MGLWPGAAYFSHRYEYATEYVKVMQELWTNGSSDFKGDHFKMNDCHMKPQPAHKVELVAAGQSPIGMDFVATYCDYNFILATGVNTPKAHSKVTDQLLESVAKTGRDVGAYVLFMVIVDETDEKAMATWLRYKAGVDVDALAWMADQGSQDKAAADSGAAKTINLPDQAVNFNMGTIVGSCATVARLLDKAATVPRGRTSTTRKMTPTSATNEIMRIMLEMKNRIVQATSSPIRHASVRT
jgi:pyrimidine oxygenase